MTINVCSLYLPFSEVISKKIMSYPNCITFNRCVLGVSILKKDSFIIEKELTQMNSYV